MTAFDLTDEPWIPVLWADGHTSDLSLRGVFTHADAIRGITGDLPTQTFALHRLLLAILHRAVDGPRTVADWQALEAAWPRVVQEVEDYLDDFQDRFDLFHPVVPFYQVTGLRTAKDEIFGLERLVADVPNGHQFFTTRAGTGLAAIGAAEAARWLVHAQAFDPSGIKSGAVGDPRVKSGKGYPIGVAWAGQLGGIEVLGDTLRQTLLLNLVPSDVPGLLARTSDDDRPPWEREHLDVTEEEPGRAPRGFVDLYTWQSRRVRLHGSREAVTGVVLSNGDKITPQNLQVVETMSLWRYSEPQTKSRGQITYMPREHDPSRVFWRGLSALLPAGSEPSGGSAVLRSLPATVLTWVGEIHERGLLAADALAVTKVHATGLAYGSNSSVVDELVDDVLALPADLLAPHAVALHATAADAVQHTEKAVDALANLARNLATAAGAGTSDPFRDSARERAYALLDAPFRTWVTSLRRTETRELALARWERAARSLLVRESAAMIACTGPAAWRGRESNGRHVDVGQSAAWFSSALASALPLALAGQETPA